MKPKPRSESQRRDAAAPIKASPFLPRYFAIQSNLPDGEPRLVSLSGAGVTVTRADSEGRALRLELHGHGEPLIELSGLLPDRHYHTGHAAQRFLRADREGRALLRVPLGGDTVLSIRPVI